MLSIDKQKKVQIIEKKVLTLLFPAANDPPYEFLYVYQFEMARFVVVPPDIDLLVSREASKTGSFC